MLEDCGSTRNDRRSALNENTVTHEGLIIKSSKLASCFPGIPVVGKQLSSAITRVFVGKCTPDNAAGEYCANTIPLWNTLFRGRDGNLIFQTRNRFFYERMSHLHFSNTSLREKICLPRRDKSIICILMKETVIECLEN